MNINKITIISTLILVVLIITVPTTYKVVDNHHKKLFNVVEQEIINGAKKCFYEEFCKENKITLRNLYDYGYLDKQYDPITKEYYNDASYVLFEKNKFKFVIVE